MTTVLIYYILTMVFGVGLCLADHQFGEILGNTWHQSIIWTLLFIALGGLYLMSFSVLGGIALAVLVIKQVRLKRLIIVIVLTINIPIWGALLFFGIQVNQIVEVIIIISYGLLAPTVSIYLGYLLCQKPKKSKSALSAI